MNRHAPGVLAVLLPAALASAASAEPLGWAVSASNSDPYVQTAPASGQAGLVSLWLWLVCDEIGGAAVAEFDVSTSGDLTALLGVTPAQRGWINLGGTGHVLLAMGGCPTAPLLAAELLFLDLGNGGTVCLVPAAASGRNVTVDCSYPRPRAFTNHVLGFSSDGSSPCVAGSCADPTGAGEPQAASWGRVKGIYR